MDLNGVGRLAKYEYWLIEYRSIKGWLLYLKLVLFFGSPLIVAVMRERYHLPNQQLLQVFVNAKGVFLFCQDLK